MPRRRSRLPRSIGRAGTLIGLALLLGGLAGGFCADSAAADSAADPLGPPVPAGTVVLIGTSGLRWDDVDDTTSTLSGLLAEAAVGVLAVRSVHDRACPIDGWLAVSAGRRAADAPPTLGGPACRAPSSTLTAPGGQARVDHWADYRAQAAAGKFDAAPGLLGDLLASTRIRAVAVGPGAAIALASSAGTLAEAWPGLAPGPEGAIDPAASATDLAQQVHDALARGPRVLVVDAGSVLDGVSVSRADQVAALDERLTFALGELPSSATVFVASLADSSGAAHLQLLAAQGPKDANALLRSASTRQDGLAQTTDLLPTLLVGAGVPQPAAAVGSPIVPATTASSAPSRYLRLIDLDQAAQEIQPIVGPFFAIVIGLQVLVFAAFAWWLSRGATARRPGARRVVVTIARQVGVFGAAIPMATFLANLWPWWRGASPPTTLSIAVLTFALPATALAALGPWRRALLGPAGVIGAVTALVLAADVATGSSLSLTSLMGGQPLEAGRFYGFSNPQFALFGLGSMLAAMALGELLRHRGRPREAALAVAAIGVVAVAVDVLPMLGADFGGPPALIPAFALLAARVGGVRVTWWRAVAVAGAAVGVVALISVLDWLRPAAERSHLGRFVQAVIDGDAAPIVARKAEQNVAILFGSPVTSLLPVLAIIVVAVLARPERFGVHALRRTYERCPTLTDALPGMGLMALIGFALNDSGTSIPPVMATLGLPLLVGVVLRVGQLDGVPSRQRPAARR